MQQGGGDDKFVHRSDYEFEITVNFLTGDVPQFMSNLYGYTAGPTDGYAMPNRPHSFAIIIWEAVCRNAKGEHQFSEVWQDLILSSWAISQPMEDGTVDIVFYGHHDSFILYENAEVVVDKFDGDGSTTSFTLSGTPLKLVNSSDLQNEDWHLDNMIYVKEKLSSQNTGVRIKSGVSESAGALDFTGYGAPASGSEVIAAYAKAVA